MRCLTNRHHVILDKSESNLCQIQKILVPLGRLGDSSYTWAVAYPGRVEGMVSRSWHMWMISRASRSIGSPKREVTLPPCQEEYISSADMKIVPIRLNGEYELGVKFQTFLDVRDNTHELISPDTPQYRGVAKQVLGLAWGKVIAMSQGIITAPSDR